MRFSTNRRKVISWSLFLLWIGTFIATKSIPPHGSEAGINMFAGLAWTVSGVLLGFDMLLSPETSILYLLNKRWNPPLMVRAAGLLFIFGNLFFAYIMVGGGLGK